MKNEKKNKKIINNERKITQKVEYNLYMCIFFCLN